GAQLAAAVRGPLLLPDDGLATELERLAPSDLYLLPGIEITSPGDAEVHRLTTPDAAALARETLEVSDEVALADTAAAATGVETITAIDAGDRVAIPANAGGGNEASPTQDASAEPGDLADIIAGLPEPDDGETVWLLAADDPLTVLAMAPMAAAAQASVVPVDGSDLFRYPELGHQLTRRGDTPIRLIGDIHADTDWQLSVITSGHELPGGGYEPFPADVRRTFIAFYGHPDSAAMGALGQQDGPEATL